MMPHMCHKPTMTVFLRNFRVSSENRPQTVISANLALFSHASLAPILIHPRKTPMILLLLVKITRQ
eukprot:scaffold13572_cov71-Cyclotella_meneghiniana.AAC.3